MLGFAAQAPHITKEIVDQAAKDTGLDTFFDAAAPRS
jgi:hypothetical protein